MMLGAELLDFNPFFSLYIVQRQGLKNLIH
uniref:Uncharacterized protein n=1 Tax=Rhizophora mucronata TaxID=61149 RepID=A0A2P2ITY9_RHIMU